METFRKYLDKGLEYFCCILLIFMTGTATWQVLSRYVFGKPSTSSESLTLISFVWMALFAAAYVFGKQDHMQMTFVLDKFSPKNQIKIKLATEIIILLFAVLVLIFGGSKISMLEMGQKESSLGIPMGYIYSALPCSGIITVLYNILNIADIKKKLF